MGWYTAAALQEQKDQGFICVAKFRGPKGVGKTRTARDFKSYLEMLGLESFIAESENGDDVYVKPATVNIERQSNGTL